jgi:hypothetical protein
MRLTVIPFFRLVAIIFLLLFSKGPIAAQQACQLRKNKDSIKVYVCSTRHLKLKTVRGSFTVNASQSEIIALFLDVIHFSEWQYGTRAARVLKHISQNELIYYAVVEAPWPVMDRDIILQMKIIQDPFAQRVTISSNALPEYLEKKDNLVRVCTFHSTWTFKTIGLNKLQADYVSQIDPGGALPVGLTTIFIALGPYETFRSLKLQILQRRQHPPECHTLHK